MNASKLVKFLAALTFMIVMIILLATCGGCQGQSHASQKANLTNTLEQKTTTNADGTIEVTTTFNGIRSNTAISDATAPPAAKDPSTSHAGDAGADASSGSAYAPAIITTVQQNARWMYATATLFCFAGLVLGISYFTTWIPFLKVTGALGIAIACEIMGGFLFLAPTIIERVGPIVSGIIVLVIIVGAVGGVIWEFKRKNDRRLAANSASAPLVAAGNPVAAAAARAAIDPDYAQKLQAAGGSPIVSSAVQTDGT